MAQPWVLFAHLANPGNFGWFEIRIGLFTYQQIWLVGSTTKPSPPLLVLKQEIVDPRKKKAAFKGSPVAYLMSIETTASRPGLEVVGIAWSTRHLPGTDHG